MKISVLIATMNRASDLQKLLESLLLQTRMPEEVLVIDQSTDGRTQELFDAFESRFAMRSTDLRYIYREEKSLVKARNAGISESVGELLTFFDDDVVLFEDYLERIERRFEEDVTLGALSGNVIISQKLGGFKWAARQALMRFFLISNFDGRMTASGFGYPIYEKEIERPLRVEMLPGCNMSFRREAIDGERFDEWFSGYGFREDADYSYRVSKRSQVMMVPEAKLYHYHSPANRLDAGTLKRMEIRNYHHVFAKYKKNGFFSEMLFLYSLLGLALIDLLEFLTTGSRAKLHKFSVSIGSMASLPRQEAMSVK